MGSSYTVSSPMPPRLRGDERGREEGVVLSDWLHLDAHIATVKERVAYILLFVSDQEVHDKVIEGSRNSEKYTFSNGGLHACVTWSPTKSFSG